MSSTRTNSEGRNGTHQIASARTETAQSNRRQQTNKSAPIHEVRFGRIRAAIWENRDDRNHSRYNITVSKSYKVEEQWRETQSFGRDDLPLVSKALDHCHTWIFQNPPQNDYRGP